MKWVARPKHSEHIVKGGKVYFINFAMTLRRNTLSYEVGEIGMRSGCESSDYELGNCVKNEEKLG